MIFWLVTWYVLGILSWLLLCWWEGFITVGDIALGIFMGLTGPLLPATLGAWHVFWRWYDFQKTVIWRKKD